MKNSILIILLTLLISNVYSQSLNYCVKGIVIDGKYKKRVQNVHVEIKSTCNDVLIDSTDYHGCYFFDSIPNCEAYWISCIRGSFNCQDGYSLYKVKVSKEQLIKLDTIFIFPVESEKRIPYIYFKQNSLDFDNVYIQFNEKEPFIDSTYKYSLNEELINFVELMKCNHQYNISIEGYCNKEDLNKYGSDLFKNRVKKIRDLLISQGINSKRIKATRYDASNNNYSDEDIKNTVNLKQKELKIVHNQRVELNLSLRCQ